MDWGVQKATELGVARISPVSCATPSSSSKVSDAMHGARAGRRSPPKPLGSAPHGRPGDHGDWRFAQRSASARGWRVLFHEGEHGVTPAPPPPRRPASEITVAVGPEGGFAPAEIVAARRAGFAVCGLGPRILRAETAAITAVALVAMRSAISASERTKGSRTLRRHPIQSENPLPWRSKSAMGP